MAIPQKEITKQTLKAAYQLVTNDLLTTFIKMKPNQSVRLTNIGTFEKQQQAVRSGLTNQVYHYLQIKFRMSQTLKKALD